MIFSIFLTGLFFLSSLGFGTLFQRRTTPVPRLYLLVPGLWMLCHLVFLSGITGILNGIVLAVLLTSGLALLVKNSRPFAGSRPAACKRTLSSLDWLSIILATGGLILLAAALNNALLPPTARDSLVYHLTLPKLYLAAGKWYDIPQNIYSYFPGMTEAAFTVIMGLQGQFPGLIHYGFGVLTLTATFSLCRELGLTRQSGLLACLALLASPLFWQEMTWPYVDLASTFFWTMAVLLFFHWRRKQSPHLLFLLGAAAGAAMCCKYTGILLVLILVPALLVELKDHHRHPSLADLSCTLAIPLLTAAIAFLPWCLRNIMLTGNPLFPFFWDIFPADHPGWDSDRALMYSILLQHYGSPIKGLLEYLSAPVLLFIKGQGGIPELFDGRPGPYFLLIWPTLLLWKSFRREIFYLYSMILIFFFFWTMNSQQARFTLVILPAAAVIISWGVQHILAWKASRLQNWLQVPLLLVVTLTLGYSLPTIADTFRQEYTPGVSDSEVIQHDYLADRLEYFPAYRFINGNLPVDAVICMVMTGNHGYYLDRDYFSDAVFESHTFRIILTASTTSSELQDYFTEQGWTHLLIRQDYFSKDFSSWQTPETARRLDNFFNQHCRLIFTSGPFLLYEVGKQAKENPAL